MSAPLPYCSVIVPTYRRPRILSGCLAALGSLDYPSDRFEVIVVDDGGDEPLDAVVAPLRERVTTTLVRQHRQGPGAARNTGAARARGTLLAFTDDDCRPTREWLVRLAREHARDPGVMLGGHTRNALTNNPFSATSQLIIDAGYAWHNGDPRDAQFLTSNNLAVPAADFREIGGFDRAFITSEDRDLCDRWVTSGRRIHYLPEAIVDHAHELTLSGFCRQHVAYGRGAFRFHAEHARRTGRRIRIEPSFYLGLHQRALGRRGGAAGWRLQAALVLWHAANFTGFVLQWAGRPGHGRAVAIA